MKLTKENIYIDLRGKSKEELTDLYWLLKNNNEKLYRDSLECFLSYKGDKVSFLIFDNDDNNWLSCDLSFIKNRNKQEVTIQQLKEILQPIRVFTPIAMKCTQEQFEAIKPKLRRFTIGFLEDFNDVPYLINNRFNIRNNITNYRCPDSKDFNIYETWNEEIFLKACGIEVDNLEQQLEKAKAEVKRLEKAIEDSKIKDKDWVYCSFNESIFKYTHGTTTNDLKKITDQELIDKLNELTKTSN